MLYPVTVEDKLRNYVIGHTELGLDLGPVIRHFCDYLPQEKVIAVTEQALGRQRAERFFPLKEEAYAH